MVESPAQLRLRTLDGMNRTHPAFWGAGLAGTFTGALLVLVGLAGPADVAGLAGGYGLMMIGSALFLLAGLKVRERLVERAESMRVRRVAIARLTAIPAPITSSAPVRSGS
jgi:hypothetical protein